MKRKFIMMPVLIQGPKQPGNDIDVYLRPLVEELLQLWNGNGARTWDEHRQEEFNLWCESKSISFPIPTHRIWDTCHIISYDFPIPMIFLPYEPKEALKY